MLGMKTTIKESLKQIALKWKDMSPAERTKYDDTIPKVAQVPGQPTKLKIKHTFEGTGLQLNGYVYFA
jgi:hypothetical protein